MFQAEDIDDSTNVWIKKKTSALLRFADFVRFKYI